jgi:HEAT repeat protein
MPSFLYATILVFVLSVASLQAQTTVGDAPELLENLNSTDPALRGSAAAALDNLHDPAAVSILVSALSSSHNASATAVLVRTLGRFDDANAVAAIANLLSTDAGVVASQQLLQMGERGTQAAVRALASDDERTRANVSEAFKSDPNLSLKILPAVLRTSISAKQREQIVGVLADSALEYEDPPGLSFVEGFLPGASDAVPSVRIAVASAVQQLADREKELADSRFPPDFALSRALPALRSLAEDRDSAVRVAAVDALGAMGRADAISILKKYVDDADPIVKAHVETALAASEHTAFPASSSQPAPKRAELHATTKEKAEARRLAFIKEWNDESAIPKLVTLLRDPSSLVRAAAADKLGQLDDRATAMNGQDHQQNLSEVPALVRALKDTHALVRAAAAEALGQIGDKRAASYLTGLLKDPKPKVLVAAADALGMMATGQGYVQDALTPEDHKAAGNGLVDLLSSSDQSVRRAAVNALVNVGTLDNMKHVVPLLKDEDVFMRSQAASALARSFYANPNSERPPELDALEQAAGPALSEALSNKETRGAALSALAAMKTPPAEAVHPLIGSLKYNVWIYADGMVRPEIQSTPFDGFDGFQGSQIDQAIDVLAKTGSPEAEPLLVKFLTAINPGAAEHATAGLAVLKDPRAIDPLLDVLREPGIGIQPDAALALGSFQDSRIVPALIACLQSDNTALRGASASALSHFRDPRVAPALIHSLTDENADVRVKVAEALGDLGDLAAVDPLARVAKTNYEAVRALVKLKSPRSVTALVSVMQDTQTDYATRGNAVAALGKLQNSEAVPALIQTMENELAADPSNPLGVQCIQALGIIKDARSVEPLRKLLGKPTMASQEAERVLKEMGYPPNPQTIPR